MYGESPMGLTLRSYAPPNVEIDVNGLTVNLFADINFTVKDKNGEIKNLFDAQFVSLYLFEYFYWWVKISIDDQKQPQKLVSAMTLFSVISYTTARKAIFDQRKQVIECLW